MLIDAERSMLLVVDVQERMMPAIHDHAEVIANVVWLVRVAQRLGIPVAATEQYAKGLGPTVAAIRTLVPETAIGGKTHFSSVAAQCLGALPGHDRPQVVVVGVETHVCLLQTALDLLEEGREVFVVADAVGSRRPFDRDTALLRMRQEGARIVTREMVGFEWVGQAATPLFRELSKEFFKP
jgi:nicotinamidase-related amidase